MVALRRCMALWLALLCLWLAPPALGEEAVTPEEAEQLMRAQGRTERALLIGIDDFVTKPSAYPSSTNNVYAMQEMFQAAVKPLETLYLPGKPVTSAEELTRLIRWIFGSAQEGDVSYLYISTHGLYDPENGVAPALLLSDGVTEGSISPQELERAFDGVAGTKVLMLDACNSGAFIGKGMVEQPEELAFLGEDFKVLTSSGAMEESWYWSAKDDGEAGERQGAFYFTQALCQALSPGSGYPADQNHDGDVTLRELYDYLLLNHAASTPQVYPQSDNFVVFSYNTEETPPMGLERSPIMDVTFSGAILDRDNQELTIEFIAVRPVRVAYQIVYQSEGSWEFTNAQLIYDEAERFTVFGDQAGAVSAGRKVRTLTIGELPEDAYGYVLVQLVTFDEQGKLMVHAGRVLCVLPETGNEGLTVDVPPTFKPSMGRELAVFVGHDYPCALSVAIIDEEGGTVYRLCHRSSTRPMGLMPEGTTLYWDGKLKNGEAASPGKYRVRAQATLNDRTITVESDWFTLE